MMKNQLWRKYFLAEKIWGEKNYNKTNFKLRCLWKSCLLQKLCVNIFGRNCDHKNVVKIKVLLTEVLLWTKSVIKKKVLKIGANKFSLKKKLWKKVLKQFCDKLYHELLFLWFFFGNMMKTTNQIVHNKNTLLSKLIFIACSGTNRKQN